jgi:hypothetical protein
MKKIIALSSLLLVAANSFCGFTDFAKTVLNSCNDQKLPLGLAAAGLTFGAGIVLNDKKKIDAICKQKREASKTDYPTVDFEACALLNNKNKMICCVDNNRGITIRKKTNSNDIFTFTETQSTFFGKTVRSGTLKLNNQKKDEKEIKFNKPQTNYYWGRIAAAVTVPVIVGYVAGRLINKVV